MPVFDDANSYPSYNVVTPTLGELLRDALRNYNQNLRIAFPAAVVRIEGDQTVTLQPLFMKKYVLQKPEPMKQINNVRVMMPQGNGWRIGYPLAVNDTGLAIVLDRNIDSFMAGTQPQHLPVDPDDNRAHNVSDTIFIPGLVNDANETTDTKGDLVLKNGGAVVRLDRFGKISISNAYGDLVKLMGSILDIGSQLASAVNTAAPGSGIPIQAAITVAKQTLNTFTG